MIPNAVIAGEVIVGVIDNPGARVWGLEAGD
jgi:hypothetical protein